jgi:3-oxoacyl-[acyl-carrier-protein] synthase III
MEDNKGQVYITNTAIFLPNKPISNDEMEEYLGFIKGKPSKSKNIVLRNNGIKRRFYAIKKNGTATHTNSQMTALAVKELFKKNPKDIDSVQLLSCGTSTPDQMIPSHAVMVHGWIPEVNAIEVVSPSGVCCSGIHSLKYAYYAVKTGDIQNAVATGSERPSRMLRSEVFTEETEHLTKLNKNPYICFEKEFLRWMLSDGAGAFLLSNKKNKKGISLRIDWIEGVSYAHKVEPCMYMASEKMEDGTLKGYMDFSPEEIISKSILSIKQDVKLLSKYTIAFGFEKLKEICKKRNFNVNEISYFLPHLSSEFFRFKIAEKLEENGMAVPQEKWFTNLSSVGNVGAGSIYIMLDELFHSGKLHLNDKILLVVPESSRFSYGFVLLTVC